VEDIDDLGDVDTSTTAPSNGDALVWDGNNWVPGTVSGGGSDDTAILSMPGDIETIVGKLRWYAPKNITLNDVMVSLGEQALSNKTIDILKNNVVIKSVVLPSGTNATARIAIGETMTDTDYLTVNVTGNGGKDLTVFIRYN
jgi:hypothetical protein